MEERELIKIKSDNPDHPKGYYIQFKDQMKPDDVEFFEDQVDPDPEPKLTKKRKNK